MTAKAWRTSETHFQWLLGGQCFRFYAYASFGKGGTHKVEIQVEADELRAAAAKLRGDLTLASITLGEATIKRGRGEQKIPITAPREMVLGLAGSIGTLTHWNEIGHAVWHYENPNSKRPCDQCPETIAAEDAAVDAARHAFVCAWAERLHTSEALISDLLADYAKLPHKRPRYR